MRYTEEEQHKIKFEGRIVSVQVRSTVWRYLTDNRTHREIGYNIFIDGMVYDDMSPEEDLSDYCVPRKGFDAKFNFSVAISEKQMQKFHFHIGDLIKGTAWTEKYPECEYADFYRAGALKKSKAKTNARLEARRGWKKLRISKLMHCEEPVCWIPGVTRGNAFSANGQQ